jgi:arsenate reductase
VAEVDLYYYRSCTSCRNAEALLNELGVDVRKHEYFKHRLTAAELTAVLNRIGKTPFDVLSTRSTPYKELDLANKSLSNEELVGLMIEHPQLLKRPITILGDQAVVGYNKGAIAALVGKGS